ncbi:MAG: hypothetical protein AB198_02130 [Parcubacteria bacterium C7867-003]|nr:MAG: hypothetical protein AB198_02130 [Parcubacteria bacterium C7867-003]
MKNQNKSLRRGFTLIELLVVIAIIGVLSSVVLASLSTSRQRGADAKTKAQLNSMIGAAQLYYDLLPSPIWTGICTTEPMNSMKISAGAINPTGNCSGTGQAGWRAYAELKVQDLYSTSPASGTDYWCVDYTAVSKICDTAPGSGPIGGVYVCPAACR